MHPEQVKPSFKPKTLEQNFKNAFKGNHRGWLTFLRDYPFDNQVLPIDRVREYGNVRRQLDIQLLGDEHKVNTRYSGDGFWVLLHYYQKFDGNSSLIHSLPVETRELAETLQGMFNEDFLQIPIAFGSELYMILSRA